VDFGVEHGAQPGTVREMKSSPIEFEPLAMERVWGGRKLGSLFGKSQPAEVPIGESWEIVDREDEQSVVVDGELQGRALQDLWSESRVEIFGKCYEDHPADRFPLLIKLLDAKETLSVQVHPPADKAAELGGEPKTEMWVFLEVEPGACIYAGTKPGTTRELFEEKLASGEVESLVPRIEVKPGQSMFIPSGRLHAIGGGNVIAEIQQNSDTTYRVFDWNRLGLDGKPRALHLAQSLASIDFQDHAPELTPADASLLADCPYFRVEKKSPPSGLPDFLDRQFALWGILKGTVRLNGKSFGPGKFLLLPAGLQCPCEISDSSCELLEITLPSNS